MPLFEIKLSANLQPLADALTEFLRVKTLFMQVELQAQAQGETTQRPAQGMMCAPYGYCPVCLTANVGRTKGPDQQYIDVCEQGHIHPQSESLTYPQAVHKSAQAEFAAPSKEKTDGNGGSDERGP